MKPMRVKPNVGRVYYVCSNVRWFLIRMRTKRAARSVGVAEFGRGWVRDVRLATEAEIAAYIEQVGPEVLQP